MCYLKHNIVFAGDSGDMGASLLLTLQSIPNCPCNSCIYTNLNFNRLLQITGSHFIKGKSLKDSRH